MLNKHNLTETRQRFADWWQCSNTDRPLMQVRAWRDVPSAPLVTLPPFSSEQKHSDINIILPSYLNFAHSVDFLCEAIPNLNLNFGPGSMAIYTGAQPRFETDTVWYEPCISDISTHPALMFDPDNYWWQRHFSLVEEARKCVGEDMYVCMPDIVENIDIIAAMRDPQELCFDLFDHPEHVKRLIVDTDKLYFEYFDRFLPLVSIDNTMMFTAFDILGEGKVGKVQSDFAALIGTEQFDEFCLPSIKQQCDKLDYSYFHLDGKECIRHLDSLLAIESLSAIQWTPNVGMPDGGNEHWFSMYDKVRNAGKAMHVFINDGGFDGWLATADKFIKRYGCRGVYLLFPMMTQAQAQALEHHALTHWGSA